MEKTNCLKKENKEEKKKGDKRRVRFNKAVHFK